MHASSVAAWMFVFLSSYWYHSPKMKEWMVFRNAISKSCRGIDNNNNDNNDLESLESCIYNLQLNLLQSEKRRHTPRSIAATTTATTSINTSAKRRKNSKRRQCFFSNVTSFGSILSSNLFNQSKLELQTLSFSDHHCMSSKHLYPLNFSISFKNSSAVFPFVSFSSKQHMPSSALTIVPARSLASSTIFKKKYKKKRKKKNRKRSSNSSPSTDDSVDYSSFGRTKNKIAELEDKIDTLVKLQVQSNDMINALAARLEIYENGLFAVRSNMEVLHNVLHYTAENLARQESDIRRLRTTKSSTRNEMKRLQENVRLSRAFLQKSLRLQKNSSQTLKSSLKTLSNSQKRILDLYDMLQSHQPMVTNTEISTLLHTDTIYSLLLLLIPVEVVFLVLCMRGCCRSSQNDTPRTFIRNPFRFFQGSNTPSQNPPENVLELIRQSDLDDMVCSLYFDTRYRLHETLTATLQQSVPELRVEHCHVSQHSDILSLPRAKTYFLFVDLKQRNGVDPIKGTDNLKITLLNGVQRMGADVFLVVTGDKNSDQLEGGNSLYRQNLKFLRAHRDVSCLISARRVLSVNETWAPHQLDHVARTIGVWHDTE